MDGSPLGHAYIMVEVATPTKPILKKKKIPMVNTIGRKALWVEYWMIVTSLHVYWLRKIHYNNSVNNIYCSFEGKLAKGIQELLIIYNTILECWKGYDSNLKCNRTFVMMLKKKIDRNLPYIIKKFLITKRILNKIWFTQFFW